MKIVNTIYKSLTQNTQIFSLKNEKNVYIFIISYQFLIKMMISGVSGDNQCMICLYETEIREDNELYPSR